MNCIRHSIVHTANKFVGKVGMTKDGMVGGEHIIKFIKEAGKNLIIWTPAREKAIRSGQWIRIGPGLDGGTSNEDERHLSWCGIFATWVYKQCGFKVDWALTSIGGQMLVNTKDIQYIGFDKITDQDRKNIRRGDVCIMNSPGKRNYHHYIVDLAGDPFETIEGNLSDPRNSVGIRKNRKRSEVVALYKVMVD